MKAHFNFLLALYLLFPLSGLANDTPCPGLPDSLMIDQVWGGTKLGFGAVESATDIYIGYYDKDRWLTVSQVSKCTGQIKRVRLPSQFAGWDAHNFVTMAIDAQGLLHVAGNMHVSPLVYARMTSPGDLQSLSVLQQQVGEKEDRTTYPMFFMLPDGALGFSYRHGRSGDGEEIINRFDGKEWKRLLDKPLFAAAAGGQHVNAYHTNYVKGPDGDFHVAWVWRNNRNVEADFNVNYARSPDLRKWYDARGRALVLPLTPENADVAALIPPGQGLFNNIRIGFDEKYRPVISYLKFDDNGATQLWHARNENGIWKNYQSTQWTYRWNPQGGGTIPAVISFAGLVVRNGVLLERVHHPDLGNVTLEYDSKSLATSHLFHKYAWPSSLSKIRRETPKNTVLTVTPVRRVDGKMDEKYSISWLSMPSDTRDREKPCHPAIADCRYAFDLLLHVSNQRVN